jgi:hypothetical protein
MVSFFSPYQLAERFTEHDSKVQELQSLVSKLQEVINKQSTIIQESTDQISILEEEQRQRQAETEEAAKANHKAADKSLLPSLWTGSPPVASKARASGLKPPSFTSTPTKLPMLATKPNNNTNPLHLR